MQKPQNVDDNASMPNTCGACGYRFPSENKFCGQCGHEIPALTHKQNKTNAAERLLGRRYVSALFSDIVRSTQMVRQLDPEQFERIMRLYQHVCNQVVKDFGGQLIEDLGDGIVALFAGRENSTESAVRAGDELVTSINNLRAFKSRSGALKLQIRVGIASGEAIVKKDASNQSQRILGQPPYLAARLQSIAKAGQVLVCPETYKKTAGIFNYGQYPAKQLKLKGFDDVQDIRVFNAPNDSNFRFDASNRINLTPLAGREEMMDALLSRWEKTTGEKGQLAMIKGTAGIGKSRVLAELQQRVKRHTPELIVLRYQCSSFAQDSPLFPVMMQISRLSLIKKSDSAKIIKLKLDRLLENWGVKTKYYSDVLLPLVLNNNRRKGMHELTEEQIELAIGAFTQIPLLFARKAPVLVVVEDAHWADDASKRLLSASISVLEKHRLMMVISYRTNEGKIPEYDEHYATDYLLKRLSNETAASLLDSINIGTPLPEEMKQNILDKSGGVPLFLEELTLCAMREMNSSEQESHLKTPASLFDLFIQRFDRFDASVKSVAQLAAILGQEFDFDMISPILGLNHDQSDTALALLIDEEQIYHLEEHSTWYQFKHALIRDAIYDNTLNSDKHRLHKAVHEHLDQLDNQQSTIVVRRIAYHKKMTKHYAAFAHAY